MHAAKPLPRTTLASPLDNAKPSPPLRCSAGPSESRGLTAAQSQALAQLLAARARATGTYAPQHSLGRPTAVTTPQPNRLGSASVDASAAVGFAGTAALAVVVAVAAAAPPPGVQEGGGAAEGVPLLAAAAAVAGAAVLPYGVEALTDFLKPRKCRSCYGAGYTPCAACGGRGKRGGLLPGAGPACGCGECGGRGRQRCGDCGGGGLANGWLWSPAEDPGWGARGS